MGIKLNNTFLILIFFFKRITILSSTKLCQKNHIHATHSSLKYERQFHVYLLKTNIIISNVYNQLAATYNSFINTSISPTCFGQIFAHPQERQTVFYSMWYNAPNLFAGRWPETRRHCLRVPDTGRQQIGCIIPHAVKHSLSFLRMGKKLPETCWADWSIKKTVVICR